MADIKENSISRLKNNNFENVIRCIGSKKFVYNSMFLHSTHTHTVCLAD